MKKNDIEPASVRSAVPSARLPVARRRQLGLTMLELMISVVVGLIMLTAVISLYTSMIRSDNDNLNSIRLNQELRAAMSLVTRDLRRVNFANDMADGTLGDDGFSVTVPTPPTDQTWEAMTIGNFGAETANSCITYAYDQNFDGVDDGNGERFGFRLNAGVIESRQAGANCAAGGWQSLTDLNLVSITTFNIIDVSVTEANIITHLVTITLAGTLVNDNTVIRTISETIKVRNSN